MRGHVLKRGKKWAFVVDVARTAEGKRKQQWFSGYQTKREAESALTEVLRSITKGDYVTPTKQTVSSYLDEWLPSIRSTVRESTLASYRQQIENHIKPNVGHHPVQALTTAHVNDMYVRLLDEGRKRGEGGLSPRTVRYVHVVLRRAMADAVKWSVVTRNVVDYATAPKGQRRVDQRPRAWSANDVRRFLELTEAHTMHPLLRLAVSTGMRRGELIALQWQDVDLDRGTLSVRRQVTNTNRELVVSAPKTARGARTLSIDGGTASLLRQHRREQAEMRLRMGGAFDNQDLVFPRPDGGFLHPDWVSKTFAKLVRASELPTIRFHDLRHTFATLALQAEVHPRVVQEILGHSQVAVTLDTYSHVIPSMQAKATETVAALWDG